MKHLVASGWRARSDVCHRPCSSAAHLATLSLILVRHACAAQLKSAAGSYCKIPPCPLLAAYLNDDSQRAFVDSMAEVSVPKHEVIMRQGALPTQPECRVRVRVRVQKWPAAAVRAVLQARVQNWPAAAVG